MVVVMLVVPLIVVVLVVEMVLVVLVLVPTAVGWSLCRHPCPAAAASTLVS